MQTQGSLPTFEDKVAQRAIVNIYLTRFDHTMTEAAYRLTRWAMLCSTSFPTSPRCPGMGSRVLREKMPAVSLADYQLGSVRNAACNVPPTWRSRYLRRCWSIFCRTRRRAMRRLWPRLCQRLISRGAIALSFSIPISSTRKLRLRWQFLTRELGCTINEDAQALAAEIKNPVPYEIGDRDTQGIPESVSRDDWSFSEGKFTDRSFTDRGDRRWRLRARQFGRNSATNHRERSDSGKKKL